jgi:predicted nucleotidyltransferase component of viral defense system
MDEERLKIWETLFQRALTIIESVARSGHALEDWSFGGGTVLMRRHHHRFSKDIDIFIPDPQYLNHLTPRLNNEVEILTTHYIEHQGALKLTFPEGEIDFVVSGPLTPKPTSVEILFNREINVETSTEIIAKKVWHRGADFAARDIFDLAMVVEKETDALASIKPILQDRREAIMTRIGKYGADLRETFAALETIDYRRSFDECVDLVTKALG